MAEKLQNLRGLFEYELKDLYSSETQIIEAFPNFIGKVNNNELKRVMQDHLEESKEQLNRLKKACEHINIDPEGVRSRGMEGLIREAEDLTKAEAEPHVMDAGLIAAVQKIEHYEIAGYGTVCTYAELLDYPEINKMLGESLNEEKSSDNQLTEIAKNINVQAIAE